jgi:chromosome segregation ATPase
MSAKNRKKQELPVVRINGRTLPNETNTDVASNDGLGNVFEAWPSLPGSPTGSRSCSPTDSNSVEQVKNVNRQLLVHIEVLRYKVALDTREQEAVIKDLVDSRSKEVQNKNSEIEKLNRAKQEKDNELKKLTEENQNKNKEVIYYNKYVADLEKEVKASKIHAEKLQVQLDNLKKEPLKRQQEHSNLDRQILEMRVEIEEMKKNFADLEEELALANEKIAQQGNRLVLMEIERGDAEIMFKENMEKATRSMRNEIGKVREVLALQHKEMIKMREENEAIKKYMQELVRISTAAKAKKVSAENDNKLVYVTPSLSSQEKPNEKPKNRRKKT